MSAPRYSGAALTYFRERGILPPLAARLGVTEDDGALIWPTVDADGLRSPRRRSLNGGPKVRGEAGRSLGLWWPLGPPERGFGVLVCEGESDAMSAASALATAGPLTNLLYDVASGVAAIPGASFPADRLVAAVKNAGASEVAVACDADAAGRAASERMIKALRTAGVSAYPVLLPDGHDLADVLARAPEAERPHQLANLLMDSRAADDERDTDVVPGDDVYRLWTPDELLALPEPSWLIDRLVPASGLTVLYGASGAGKSFVALDWALCVATGLPWFGQKVERRHVVYLAAEGRGGLGARYRAWSYARGCPDARRMRFLAEAVDLRDRRTVERLRRTLACLPAGPRLLVIDTMARTMVGGDENAAKDVGEFIAAVDRLRGPDAALVVHHSGKDGASERGSSALRAAADLMAKVTRNEARGPRLTLSCEKMKDAPEWEPVHLRMEQASGSIVLSRRIDARERQSDLRGRVLDLVARGDAKSKNAVTNSVKGRRADVIAALDALEAEGAIEKTSAGYEVIPGGPVPPGNYLLGASGGGGSGEEDPPVGGLRGNRPAPPPMKWFRRWERDLGAEPAKRLLRRRDAARPVRARRPQRPRRHR